MIGTLVLVRTHSAGVHVGTLIDQSGTEVRLRNAMRIWRWRGANTLHELALHGADTSWSRISEPVSEIILTQAIEIISVADGAAETLTTPRWGR